MKYVFMLFLVACDGPYPAQISSCQEACTASGTAMASVGRDGCVCQPVRVSPYVEVP